MKTPLSAGACDRAVSGIGSSTARRLHACCGRCSEPSHCACILQSTNKFKTLCGSGAGLDRTTKLSGIQGWKDVCKWPGLRRGPSNSSGIIKITSTFIHQLRIAHAYFNRLNIQILVRSLFHHGDAPPSDFTRTTNKPTILIP